MLLIKPSIVAAVTGGRDFVLSDLGAEWLVSFLTLNGVTEMRNGLARGLDRAARNVVRSHRRTRGLVTVTDWPADWEKHGRAAGAIRNREMLRGGLSGPVVDWLIVFPGGRGTRDCEQAAMKIGSIRVVHPGGRNIP